MPRSAAIRSGTAAHHPELPRPAGIAPRLELLPARIGTPKPRRRFDLPVQRDRGETPHPPGKKSSGRSIRNFAGRVRRTLITRSTAAAHYRSGGEREIIVELGGRRSPSSSSSAEALEKSCSGFLGKKRVESSPVSPGERNRRQAPPYPRARIL
ncbi:hypothetical protein NL676_021733 [Syzygium grande]|nr:hypothetical protein NL676_021733 [Syzygium grande]